MKAEMTNETGRQWSLKRTEDKAGAEREVTENSAPTRSEQHAQFLAWWSEYQKKMRSAFRCGALEPGMQV
jgi:hypothetical protein